MEPCATQLGNNALWIPGQISVRKCHVCDVDMTRGVVEHLPSHKHWKSLWEKLGQRIPDADSVRVWTGPWVERFDTPRGVYLLNHVTGEQGLEHEVVAAGFPPRTQASDSRPSAHPQRAAAPPAAAPPHHVSSASSPILPIAAALQPAIATESLLATSGHRRHDEQIIHPATTSKFDLPSWIWQRYIEEGARKLQRALERASASGTATVAVKCAVCEEMTEDVAFHLTSSQHFQRLQTRMSARDAPPRNDELPNGPWVQAFSVGTRIVRYNHLTGAVHEPAEIESC